MDRFPNLRAHAAFPGSLDARSIGLFRILLGIVLLADLLVFRAPNLKAFYSESGVFGGEQFYKFGLLEVFTSEAAVLAFFAVTFAAYTLFTLGWWPRLFGVASLICLWSIHQRRPEIIATDDLALICLLFWSLFLPLADRFAVSPRSNVRPGQMVRGLAAFAILVQVALIYFFNAYSKTGPTWSTGVAVSYALIEDLWAKDSAAWLAAHTGLCHLLTYAVKPFEFSMPLLILWPIRNDYTRAAAATLSFIFHWSIFAFVSLGFFPLITSCWSALLIPSFVWDRLSLLKASRVGQTAASGEERQQPHLWRSPSVRIGKAVNAVLLSAAFVLMLLQNARSLEGLRSWPAPPLLGVLDRTSLFAQRWALYAPDATIVSKWIKVKVVTGDAQELDAWTVRPFHADNSELNAYRQFEPWQNLASVVLHNSVERERLAGNWARYEYERWNDRHRDRPAVRIEIVAFERTILAPQVTTSISSLVIGSYP